MHLKECVAIAYFQFSVNRKHDKRCELFNKCLYYSASYAPAAGGVLKKCYPGCRVRKFSVLTQKLFFWHAFKNWHLTATTADVYNHLLYANIRQTVLMYSTYSISALRNNYVIIEEDNVYRPLGKNNNRRRKQ